MNKQIKVNVEGIEPVEVCDGVTLVVKEITYRDDRPTNGRNKSRLYVSVEGENLLENFAYRTNRPFDQYRKVLPQVLKALGIPDAKAHWNRHAGCSMCPCSPGFILSGDTEYENTYYRTRNIWVTLTGDAPKVTDDDAALAEASDRANQLASQLQ